MMLVAPTPKYQAGGALLEDAFYLPRAADEEIHERLLRGVPCYLLAPRQVGKSSLKFRTVRRLEDEGCRCAALDLTAYGTSGVEADSWYQGLALDIASELGVMKGALDAWAALSGAPAARFYAFVRTFVMARVTEPVSSSLTRSTSP